MTTWGRTTPWGGRWPRWGTSGSPAWPRRGARAKPGQRGCGAWRVAGKAQRWALRLQSPSLSLLPSPQVRQLVTEYCVLPLGIREVHERAPYAKAVLLYGPRRCGKTMLARAVAGAAGAMLLDLSPTTTNGRYRGKGETAKMVHMVFKVARLYAPSVILVDHFEKARGTRCGWGGRLRRLCSRSPPCHHWALSPCSDALPRSCPPGHGGGPQAPEGVERGAAPGRARQPHQEGPGQGVQVQRPRGPGPHPRPLPRPL